MGGVETRSLATSATPASSCSSPRRESDPIRRLTKAVLYRLSYEGKENGQPLGAAPRRRDDLAHLLCGCPGGRERN